MLTADFDYELAPDRIAQHPVPRGEARLLCLPGSGAPEHRRISDLPALLRAGDLLVVNDTRVLPARLFGRLLRPRPNPGQDPGARLELLLVERRGPTEWDCLLKPAKKAPPGAKIGLLAGESLSGIEAEVLAAGAEGRRRLRFSAPLEPRLEELGHVPLPPYIKRADDRADRDLYQTMFARRPGAIAAPTAGLHFTPGLTAALAAAGVDRAAVTLHVGLGTFKPMTAEHVADHTMDQEEYEVPPETAEAIHEIRARGGRVVAVGTTVVRTLETAAATTGAVEPGSGRTRLFITPGFRFQAVDVLLTNFHLPRSTLLMLVAAFAGQERVLAAYREAVTVRLPLLLLRRRDAGRAAGLSVPDDGRSPSGAPCSGA